MHQLDAQIKEVFSGPHPMSHKLYKRVPVTSTPEKPATGYTSVESGTETVDIYVTVDLEAIARSLGHKAMANKSRQSKYLGGAVIVEARNIQRKEF